MRDSSSAQPARLLVVGGTGFIGSHVIERAVALGYWVTSLSLSSSDVGPDDGIRRVRADLADGAAVRAALGTGEFEYVVNCGGYVDHSLYAKGGGRVLDVHFAGVRNLVDLLDRSTLRSFVNIGSSDEYGATAAPQREDQREAPISPYSLGKLAATHLLQMLHRTDGFPATTLRLFLTYGPRQGRARFIPQVIRGCLEGREFPVSAGGQLRDFCFVKDVSDAIFAALGTSAAYGEVLNVASGRGVTIREMVERIVAITGSGTPQFGLIPYRPGENMALYADVTKARSCLGWTPTTSLDDGLRATVAALRLLQAPGA